MVGPAVRSAVPRVDSGHDQRHNNREHHATQDRYLDSGEPAEQDEDQNEDE